MKTYLSKTAAAVLLSVLAGLFSGCRYGYYLFHDDNGYRQIPFPHGSISNVHVINSQAVLTGSAEGCGILTLNLAEPSSPRYTGGIPYPRCSGAHVFYGNYGYFATLRSILVVKFSEDPSVPPELLENIMLPERDSPEQLKIDGHYLYVLCTGGLRTYDIASPGRPIPANFDPSFRDVSLYQPMDGRIWKVMKKDMRTLVMPDGKKKTYPDIIRELHITGDGQLLMQTDGKDLINVEGSTILKTPYCLASSAKGITYLKKETDKTWTYHVRSGGTDRSYTLPEGFREDGFYHSDGNRFIHFCFGKHVLYSGILEDGKAKILSQTPVISGNAPLYARNGMVYGVSAGHNSDIRIFGFDYKRPPYDGTPFDFTFSYKLDGNPVIKPEPALHFAGRYLFAPGVLLDMSKKTPVIAAKTGVPASVIRQSGRHLAMIQDREVNVYDISGLPVMKKVFTLHGFNPWCDIIIEGNMLYLLDAFALSVYDITKPAKRLSYLALKERSALMAKVGNMLYLLPYAKPHRKDGWSVCPPKNPEPLPEAKSLRIIHAEDPAKPFLLKTVPDFLTKLPAQVFRHGNSLLIPDGSVIRRFDVANPESPVPAGMYSGKSSGMLNYSFLTMEGSSLIGGKTTHLDVWDDIGNTMKGK